MPFDDVLDEDEGLRISTVGKCCCMPATARGMAPFRIASIMTALLAELER